MTYFYPLSRQIRKIEAIKEQVWTNEVSTNHDMNYGQVWYPTLVDKSINFTHKSRTFVWHQLKKWLDQKINFGSINFFWSSFVKKMP